MYLARLGLERYFVFPCFYFLFCPSLFTFSFCSSFSPFCLAVNSQKVDVVLFCECRQLQHLVLPQRTHWKRPYGMRPLLFAFLSSFHFLFLNSSASRSRISLSNILIFHQKFAPKNSFRAFQQLLALFGDQYFQGIIQEDTTTLFAYSFGPHGSSATHIVFWRPINGTDTTSLSTTLSVPYVPVSSYLLDGSSPKVRDESGRFFLFYLFIFYIFYFHLYIVF